MKKIAIGHHIGERAHVLEREQNLHSGDREERQEFINLDEGRVKVDIVSSFLWYIYGYWAVGRNTDLLFGLLHRCETIK
jgi:hypothetical protein